MNPTRAPFRVPRAAVVAVTVLALAAAAHTLAGGELPGLPVMAALTAVVGLSAVMLAGTKMTARILASYLGASQAALHLGFSALSGPGRPLAGPTHHLGMPAGAGPVDAVVAHDHLSSDTSFGMLGMHLAAVLLTALLMARGESALWALAAWLRPLVEPPKPTVLQATHQVMVTAAETTPVHGKVPGRPPVRGPPLGLRAAAL